MLRSRSSLKRCLHQTLTDMFGKAFWTWRCKVLRTSCWRFVLHIAYESVSGDITRLDNLMWRAQPKSLNYGRTVLWDLVAITNVTWWRWQEVISSVSKTKPKLLLFCSVLYLKMPYFITCGRSLSEDCLY